MAPLGFEICIRLLVTFDDFPDVGTAHGVSNSHVRTKYKEKIREEERASGIDCEETHLDAAVEEIVDKEKAADMERNEQAGTLTKKKNTRVRRQVLKRLGKTQKRNADSEEGKPSKRGKKRSSDAVEYLKEKFELESRLRKDEMEFKNVDGSAESNAQAAIRNDEDGTTTESVINGIIGKSYIHKMTIISLLKILETSFKIGCT
ncbi:hypothetical protein P5673_030234 [Acropora cervicornis]|uniref:Uncharacterized protein n=1 Tax=Acropora cervicornis TaxID=6130 RepID=A0AAD9PUS7_ACRCE|nr:hypothetical protein P5673_030234 [Acropora cervicornis]